MRFTLPTDSNARKEIPLWRGCLAYFAAALAGVAFHSKWGNDKHNPGEEMHHARDKSTDHADCIVRHLFDLHDLLAARKRGEDVSVRAILDEADALSWRSLALSQELHEKFGNVPLAPGASAGTTGSLRTPAEIDDYIERLNTDALRMSYVFPEAR